MALITMEDMEGFFTLSTLARISVVLDVLLISIPN